MVNKFESKQMLLNLNIKMVIQNHNNLMIIKQIKMQQYKDLKVLLKTWGQENQTLKLMDLKVLIEIVIYAQLVMIHYK